MSSTADWRKLAESNEMFPGGKSAKDILNLTNALRAACDRVDELESDQLDASQVGAQLMLRLGEHIEARQKAEARVAELEKLNSGMVDGHIVYGRAMVPAESSDLLKRAEAAEARCKELESHRAAAQHASINDCERAEKAEARLKVAVDALSAWLSAYDSTVPDNGPALTEHECAEQARAALAKLREGEP